MLNTSLLQPAAHEAAGLDQRCPRRVLEQRYAFAGWHLEITVRDQVTAP
jgi:hypothetical protein